MAAADPGPAASRPAARSSTRRGTACGGPRVERATGPVDVIHATGVAVPPRTAPLVVTVHDLSYLVYPEHFSRQGRRFFRQALELTRRDADLVLCSSEATRRALRGGGHRPGAAAHRAARRRATRRVRRGRRARPRAAYGLERPYVLWVGTRRAAQEPPAAARRVRAARHGRRARARRPPRLEPGARRRRRGVRDCSASVPAPTSPPLYAGAEAFCFPSLLEGFGMPVVDAMAQGTPVVTSRGTSTEEIAGDAGLVVDPRDVGRDRRRRSSRVLRDPALAQRLGEAGRARAADLHVGAHGGSHRRGLRGGRRAVTEVGDAAGVRLPLERRRPAPAQPRTAPRPGRTSPSPPWSCASWKRTSAPGARCGRQCSQSARDGVVARGRRRSRIRSTGARRRLDRARVGDDEVDPVLPARSARASSRARGRGRRPCTARRVGRGRRTTTRASPPPTAAASRNVVPPLKRPISTTVASGARARAGRGARPRRAPARCTPWLSWLLEKRNSRSSKPSIRSGSQRAVVKRTSRGSPTTAAWTSVRPGPVRPAAARHPFTCSLIGGPR